MINDFITFLIPLSLGKNIPKYFLLLYCAFGKYLKKSLLGNKTYKRNKTETNKATRSISECSEGRGTFLGSTNNSYTGGTMCVCVSKKGTLSSSY